MNKVFLVLLLFLLGSNVVLAAKLRGDDISKINEVFSIIKEKYPSETNDDTIMAGALEGMLQSLDQYSSYYNPEDYAFFKSESEGKYGGIGIQYEKVKNKFRIIKVMPGEGADLAGIVVDDVITHVDNVSTNGLSITKVANMIRGEPGTSVMIKITRGNKDLTFNILRQEIKSESVIYEIHNTTAIFRLTSFNRQTYSQLLLAIKKSVLQNKNVNSIIIDLRNNAGGLLDQAVDVSNIFLQDFVRIVSVKVKDDYMLDDYVANDLPDLAHGMPIVVLINGESASSAEIVAAALRDNQRAALVGEKTFGKAAVQAFIDLNSIPGAAVKITFAHYYTPKDQKIDQIGIKPDVEVKNSASFVISPDDLVLEDDLQMKKAISIVTNLEQYKKIIKPTSAVKITSKKW